MYASCGLLLHRLRQLDLIHELNQCVVARKLGSRRSTLIPEKLKLRGLIDRAEILQEPSNHSKSIGFADLGFQIKPDVIVDHLFVEHFSKPRWLRFWRLVRCHFAEYFLSTSSTACGVSGSSASRGNPSHLTTPAGSKRMTCGMPIILSLSFVRCWVSIATA